MKKGRTITSALILTAFFIAIFFIGWTQFRVKIGYIGVVMSKTGGIDDRAVKPGKFSYHAEFLLPTNAKLVLFAIKAKTFTPVISGKTEKDTEYTYETEITLALQEDELTRFLKEKSIFSEEELAIYEENYAMEIAEKAAKTLLKKREENISPVSLSSGEIKNLSAVKETSPFRVISFKITKENFSVKKPNEEQSPATSETENPSIQHEKPEKIESSPQKSI